MIQVNELRIGNYYHEYGSLNFGNKVIVREFQRVKAIDEKQNCVGDGIPLTPEILKKCGFILNSGLWMLAYKDVLVCLIVCFDNNTLGIEDDFGEIANIKLPTYLHQLQNLYFALTGEELPITP